MATKLEVPVTFVMPDTAMHSAQEQMLQGEVGMRRITEALCNADSENAEAWMKEDEVKVKGPAGKGCRCFAFTCVASC